MVGSGKVHSKENDTGPDGANHNWDGIFLMAEGKALGKGTSNPRPLEALRLYDVAPTILEAFRISPFPQMQGVVIGERLARAV
jgi:predicted AlkP superfamily phosphohydrolase/phosphomutase